MIDQNTDYKRSYWKANLRVIIVLLAIWLIASCLCGVVFIEQLNEYSIGNLPFGFWMANQGSLLTFVVLILCYAVIMDVIDRRFRRSIGRTGDSVDD